MLAPQRETGRCEETQGLVTGRIATDAARALRRRRHWHCTAWHEKFEPTTNNSLNSQGREEGPLNGARDWWGKATKPAVCACRAVRAQQRATVRPCVGGCQWVRAHVEHLPV